MICYWATPIAFEGHLYGFAGEFDKRIDLRCIDLADGKVKWSKEGFGKGALLNADGQLIATTKAGDLVLVLRATPTAAMRNEPASNCSATTERCRRCRGVACSCAISRTFCAWMWGNDVLLPLPALGERAGDMRGRPVR